ncbi:MAG TPA: hypothetical protein VNN22_18595 [Verrucomicrobiae bacterium]|nr:hypothetical protein [Verrucomicrobiae bacterium]
MNPTVLKELAPALAAAPDPRVSTGALVRCKSDESAVEVANVFSPVKSQAAIEAACAFVARKPERTSIATTFAHLKQVENGCAAGAWLCRGGKVSDFENVTNINKNIMVDE